MKLSVIIPAYNAEQTLAACVESVFSALGNIELEIIVIDDGSSDGTLKLLASLAAGHPGIRVLNRANGGVSAARNLGLLQASGEWVTFVDADDTLDASCGPVLARALKATSDILILRSFTGNKERYPWAGLFEDGSVSNRSDLMQKGYLRGSICGCIFHRNFLIDNGLRFPKGVRLSEDTVFFSACLSMASSIRFCNIPFYRIGVSESSASRTFRPDDPEQLALAMDAVAASVQDGPVRNYTLYKLMIVLASRSAAAGIPAGEICRRCGLSGRLPLKLEGIYAERFKIRILNLSFSLFRRLIALRDSFR